MAQKDIFNAYLYNSGFFEGCERPVGDNPTLIGPEKEVAGEIQNKLIRQGRVVFIDLGGMIGTSDIILASFLREEIAQGRLTIAVTNKEGDFSPEEAIAEAKRRLDKHGSFTNWQISLNQAASPLERKQLVDERPLVKYPETVGFIEGNHHLVSYLSNVDTTHLLQRLKNLGLEGADIVHESLGGLYHHPYKKGAIKALTQGVREDGLIFTTEPVHEDPSRYGCLETHGIIFERTSGDYFIYRRR